MSPCRRGQLRWPRNIYPCAKLQQSLRAYPRAASRPADPGLTFSMHSRDIQSIHGHNRDEQSSSLLQEWWLLEGFNFR